MIHPEIDPNATPIEAPASCLTLLTCSEAAKYLHVSVSTVKRMSDQGVLDTRRTSGGHRRITLASLKQYERQSSSNQAKPPETTAPLKSWNVEETVHLLRDHPAELERRILAEFRSGSELAVILDKLLSSAMWSVGDRWADGSMDVSDEHVCTHNLYCLLGSLRSLIRRQPPPGRQRGALGGTAAYEGHSLASVMVELVLLDRGWKAENLGSLLPIESLLYAVEYAQPDFVWVSYTCVPNEERAITDNHRLFEALPEQTRLLIGGQGLSEGLRKELRYDFLGESMTQLSQFVESFVSIRSARCANVAVPRSR